MNRPIGATADGATVLRPGRHYRLLLVVTGATDTDALAAALAGAGLSGERLGISLPDGWQHERPPDWPEETLFGLTNAQSLIRVSGPCFTRGPVRIESEMAIEPGASFRVVEAWDYGEAKAPPALERVGAAAPAPQPRSTGKKILFAAGAIAAGVVGWNWLQGKRKEERDEERLLKLADRAEKAELSAAVQDMVGGGMSRTEALNAIERMPSSSCGGGCSHPLLEGMEEAPVYVRVR